MSVTVSRQHGVSRGTRTADNRYTSTETWIVRGATLGATYNHYTVCDVAGLPAIGDHDASGIATCKSLTARLTKEASQSVWEVDVEYEFEPNKGSDKTQNPNDPDATNPDPEKRTPSYRWGDIRKDKVLEKDIDGNAITNSCGKKFPKTLMQDVYYGTLSITRKMQTYDHERYAAARGCINADQLTLFDPGGSIIKAKCARLTSVTGIQYFEGDWKGYEVTFNFELSDIPWNPLKILDEGYTYWQNGTEGDADVPFTDGLGRPTGKADLLDGHGYKLTGTGASLYPYFIEVKAYKEIPMNNMIF